MLAQDCEILEEVQSVQLMERDLECLREIQEELRILIEESRKFLAAYS